MPGHLSRRSCHRKSELVLMWKLLGTSSCRRLTSCCSSKRSCSEFGFHRADEKICKGQPPIPKLPPPLALLPCALHSTKIPKGWIQHKSIKVRTLSRFMFMQRNHLARKVKILDQSMDHKMIIKQLSGTIHSGHLLNRRSCCYGHLCCRACRPGACLSWRSGAAGSARILTGAKIQTGPERQLHWLKRRCPAQKGMVQWWVPNKIYSLIRTILCDLIFVLYTYIYITIYNTLI